VIRLVDSHCHLQSPDFEADRTEVAARAAEAGVAAIVCPATDAASARDAIGLARAGLPVTIAAGIHPGSVGRVGADEWERVRELAGESEIVAIGETGLDYFRGRDNAAEQRASFAQHLDLAAERGLPVVVHNREADEDVLAMIAEWHGGRDDRIAVLHCFVGSPQLADRALALGCYFGFGGPLTFRSAEGVRTTAAHVPLDRILVETDAPYLAPHPHRGSRNEPARVRLVAEQLAAVRGLTLESVADATAENALRVFGDRLRLLVAPTTSRSAA
jgi:TatD DNase family protein